MPVRVGDETFVPLALPWKTTRLKTNSLRQGTSTFSGKPSWSCQNMNQNTHWYLKSQVGDGHTLTSRTASGIVVSFFELASFFTRRKTPCLADCNSRHEHPASADAQNFRSLWGECLAAAWSNGVGSIGNGPGRCKTKRKMHSTLPWKVSALKSSRWSCKAVGSSCQTWTVWIISKICHRLR